MAEGGARTHDLQVKEDTQMLLYSIAINFNENTADSFREFIFLYKKWSLVRHSAISMLRELIDSIISFKESTKKVKYVSSGVGVGSGVAAIAGGALALAPVTGGISALVAPALIGGGTVAGIISGVASLGTSYFEKRKLKSFNDRILEVLRKDKEQFQIIAEKLHNIMFLTNDFVFLIHETIIGYDLTSLIATKEDWMDLLYKQVELLLQKWVPQLMTLDLQSIFQHLKAFKATADLLKIKDLAGFALSFGAKGNGILTGTRNSLSIGAKEKDLGAGIGKTLSAADKGFAAGTGKTGSRLIPALSIVGNAIALSLNIYELVSLALEEDFKDSKQGKELEDIVKQLQVQADEFDTFYFNIKERLLP